MIKIKEAFSNLSTEQYTQLLDAPVWLALLAAYASDGRLTDAERDDAIRLAHVRQFTAPKSIRELYQKISARFPRRLKQLHDRLPDAANDKLIYIRAQVKAAHALLHLLDADVAESLEENFVSFYDHVFNSDKSFFHYFALPVFASHVEKHHNKHRRLSEVAA
jgi:hypothetical protein